MMTLPEFTDPHPDPEFLRAEQQRLRKQTDKLVKSTGIFDIFANHGQLTEIGGSYKYDLMVYPDLDLGLISEVADKQTFAGLVRAMVESKYVRRVTTADTVNFESMHAGRPKGYWLGLEIPFENERWGVDCWLQKPQWIENDTDIYAEPPSQLGQPQRDLILVAKYDLIRRGLYGKTVFFSDVYDAVLGNEVNTLEDLQRLLKLE